MENLDSCVTWHCISSRCEEDVSKFMPVGEIYDNGVCLDVFDKTHNLSNESYKLIRDQVLQMEHEDCICTGVPGVVQDSQE